jgi:hypothetical protein
MPVRYKQKSIPMRTNYDPDEEKAKSKIYSFNFSINGEDCSIWYDQEKHDLCFDCLDSDIEESLRDFLVNLTRLIVVEAEASCIEVSDLRKFARKHLKYEIKINKE